MGIFKKECDHFFGPVDERGFQYCTKCGRAIQVIIECFHDWKQEEGYTETNLLRGNTVNHLWKLRCTKCGDIKIVSMNKEKDK
jgi:hypothetical protein